MDKAALPPPDGIDSNFVGPPSLRVATIVATSIYMTIIVTAISAKMVTKIWILKTFHLEDYLTLISFAGIVTSMALFQMCAEYGMARHMWDVRKRDMSNIKRSLDSLFIVYGPTIMLAKVAVVFSIKRIFVTKQRKGPIYWAYLITALVIIAYYTAYTFVQILKCQPREKDWNPSVEGKCLVNNKIVILSNGVLNVVTDLMLLALPIWTIWHLQMPVKRKLAVGAIFGTGLFGCILGAINVAYRTMAVETSDFTYSITTVVLWGLAEYTVVTLVGCMPTIPLLAKTIMGKRAPQTPPVPAYTFADTSKGRGRALGSNGRYMGTDSVEILHPVEGADLELSERGYASHGLDRKSSDNSNMDYKPDPVYLGR